MIDITVSRQVICRLCSTLLLSPFRKSIRSLKYTKNHLLSHAQTGDFSYFLILSAAILLRSRFRTLPAAFIGNLSVKNTYFGTL